MAERDMASRFAAGIPDAAVMRIGRVTRYDAASITVAIADSDALVDAAYLPSYEPILGELAVVLKQGSQWVVLGGLAGMPPDNVIENPSFEADPDGTSPPTGWNVHHVGGPSATATATVQVQTQFGSMVVDGRQVLEVGLGVVGVAITYVSSSPIPVEPGQAWAAAAYWASFVANGGAQPSDVELLLTWYANSSDTYPTTAAADTSIAILGTPQGDSARWILLRPVFGIHGATVPAGASFMRVSLRTVLRDGDSYIWWDRIVARRLS